MPQKQNKVVINAKVMPQTKEAFAELCASKRPPVTMSAYIEYLIKEELERQSIAPDSTITNPDNQPQANRDPRHRQHKDS